MGTIKQLKKENMKKFLIIIPMIMALIFNSYAQNNVTITDDDNHTADESAVLDIYSISKGVLVPRMTDAQISVISNPATGLLVFNTDMNSFYFYNGSAWNDLSFTPETYWSENGSTGNIYLDDLNKNVGIGTDDPISKLAVVAGSGANPDDPLFEIRDEFGEPLFTVTSEGARFYVKNDSKGVSGGFAVSKYGAAKSFPDTSYLMVSPDSTRVYTLNSGKGVAGGFAVGKYGSAKDGIDTYMHLTDENYFIGHNAGSSITTGLYNLFLGYESGMITDEGGENIFVGYQSGHLNESGDRNVFIGPASGYNNISGFSNVAIGDSAYFANESGAVNVIIGYRAGYTSTNASNNTYIGAGAGKFSEGWSNTFIGNSSGTFNYTGQNNVAVGLLAGLYSTGDNNVFLGSNAGFGSFSSGAGEGNVFIGYKAGYNATGDNQLFIENSDSNTPLIYGNFNSDLVGINQSIPTAHLHIKQLGVNEEALTIENDNNTDTYSFEISNPWMYLSYNGTNVGHWEPDGSYVSTSDKKLKKDIDYLENGVLSKLLNLKPVSYRLKHEKSTDAINFGFIAQDVMEVMPELVHQENGKGLFSLHYPDFGVLAIKAIQEQQDKIEYLEQKNKELEKEIQEIKRLLNHK
jgi:hypothetical protein